MTILYKIVPEDFWREARAKGIFAGSPVDLADGYIHFSTAAQAPETARRHFHAQHGLLLVAIDSLALAEGLRWEPSRGGDLFPHLYAPLRISAAIWAKPLPWDGTRHIFPEGWTS